MDLEGLFFFGKELGYVDIMYVFWFYRSYILKYYRDFEVFQIEDYRRFYVWVIVVNSYFSIKVVEQDKERVLVFFKFYVEGNVKFEFVDVIRKKIIIF